jgi:hypothetical protein
MNDHDAMTAINAALDRYFRGEVTELQTVNSIARISGLNTTEHAEAAK